MEAVRDQNHIPSALGVSSTDATLTIAFRVDPETGRLLTVSTDGGIIGPVSSTDNAIARWNGTTGEEVQNSLATVDDTGVINAVGYKAGGTAAVADGTYTVGNKITAVTGTNGTITVKGGIITAIQQAT